MHDIQTHLTVYCQKRLFAHDFFAWDQLWREMLEDQTSKQKTYAGNSPRHLATYSLRTVPAINSSETLRARSAESGMIIKPEVSLSSLFTAERGWFVSGNLGKLF